MAYQCIVNFCRRKFLYTNLRIHYNNSHTRGFKISGSGFAGPLISFYATSYPATTRYLYLLLRESASAPEPVLPWELPWAEAEPL